MGGSIVGAGEAIATQERATEPFTPTDAVMRRWLLARAAQRMRDARLTGRERDVIAYVLAGDDDATIARRLTIRPATVRSTLARVSRRLGTESRTGTILALMGVTGDDA